jgi:hypothetical protein
MNKNQYPLPIVEIDKLIERVQNMKYGFKDIQKAAYELIDEQTVNANYSLARQLFNSEVFQVRCLAVFMFGRLAANSNKTVDFLKKDVSKDNDWRVQEILAKALTGFVQTLVTKNLYLPSRNGCRILCLMFEGQLLRDSEFGPVDLFLKKIQKLQSSY